MRLPRTLLDQPDDLDARLAWAEALEPDDPDLAAFIRAGVALARTTPDHPDAAKLERQARALYRARARDALYAPHQRWLTAPILHGGLIEGGCTDAAGFLAAAESRFSVLPLRHLVLTQARPVLRQLLDAPWLQRLRSLELPSAGLDDDDAATLAQAPALAHLAWLGLTDNAIGLQGLQVLAASPHLARLQRLDLSHNPAPDLDPEPLLDQGQVVGYLPNPTAQRLIRRFGERPWLHHDLRRDLSRTQLPAHPEDTLWDSPSPSA